MLSIVDCCEILVDYRSLQAWEKTVVNLYLSDYCKSPRRLWSIFQGFDFSSLTGANKSSRGTVALEVSNEIFSVGIQR